MCENDVDVQNNNENKKHNAKSEAINIYIITLNEYNQL